MSVRVRVPRRLGHAHHGLSIEQSSAARIDIGENGNVIGLD
jgi:hypothetical protein